MGPVQPTANPNRAFPVQPILLIRVQPTANPNLAYPVQPTANPNLAYPVQPTANPNRAYPVQPRVCVGIMRQFLLWVYQVNTSIFIKNERQTKV